MNAQLATLKERLEQMESMIQFLNSETTNIKNEISSLQQNCTNAPAQQQNVCMDTHSRLSIHLPTFSSSTTIFINEANPGLANSSNSPLGSFLTDNDYVIVYIAVAGPIYAKCGIGIYFGQDNQHNVSKVLNGMTTANRGEISACIQALEILWAKRIGKSRIYTSSNYLSRCLTEWIATWTNNNWRTAQGGDVKNKDLLVKLAEWKSKFVDIECKYVEEQLQSRGIEEAKRLASSSLS